MSEIPNTPAELFWQAFRYVGNEMTPVEREAFEVLLITDQHAREAVARVVQLEGLVCGAEPWAAESMPVEIARPLSVLPIERSYWMQPVGWVAVGAAACLAVVMALQALSPPGSQTGAGGGPSTAAQFATSGSPESRNLTPGHFRSENPAAGELAMLWAQAHASAPATDDSAVEADAETAEQDLATVSDEQAAPGWLLAAVADSRAANDEN